MRKFIHCNTERSRSSIIALFDTAVALKAYACIAWSIDLTKLVEDLTKNAMCIEQREVSQNHICYEINDFYSILS